MWTTSVCVYLCVYMVCVSTWYVRYVWYVCFKVCVCMICIWTHTTYYQYDYMIQLTFKKTETTFYYVLSEWFPRKRSWIFYWNNKSSKFIGFEGVCNLESRFKCPKCFFFNLKNASSGIPVTQDVKSSTCHPRNSHQWHRWNSHFFQVHFFHYVFPGALLPLFVSLFVFQVHFFHYLFHYSFSRYTFFTIYFHYSFSRYTFFTLFFTMFFTIFFRVHFFHTFFSLFFSRYTFFTLFFTLFFTIFFRVHFFHTFFSLFFSRYTFFFRFQKSKKSVPLRENSQN